MFQESIIYILNPLHLSYKMLIKKKSVIQYVIMQPKIAFNSVITRRIIMKYKGQIQYSSLFKQVNGYLLHS